MTLTGDTTLFDNAPLIGISGRTKTAREANMPLKMLGDLHIDLYHCDYARGVLAAGGIPLFLPSTGDPAIYVNRIDGLVLSGGADIEPHHYGQTRCADMFPSAKAHEAFKFFTPEPSRDIFELGLLDSAAAIELPVLGICRGIQMLNVHGGGTLHQHVGYHAHMSQAPNSTPHGVNLLKGSLAASLYGHSIKVNSFHHQTVAEVADGYIATGYSDEGSIEALESEQMPWLGLQWHPELLDSRDSDPAFAWLVQTSSSYRDKRAAQKRM